jgi:hypothetical protein
MPPERHWKYHLNCSIPGFSTVYQWDPSTGEMKSYTENEQKEKIKKERLEHSIWIIESHYKNC